MCGTWTAGLTSATRNYHRSSKVVCMSRFSAEHASFFGITSPGASSRRPNDGGLRQCDGVPERIGSFRRSCRRILLHLHPLSSATVRTLCSAPHFGTDDMLDAYQGAPGGGNLIASIHCFA